MPETPLLIKIGHVRTATTEPTVKNVEVGAISTEDLQPGTKLSGLQTLEDLSALVSRMSIVLGTWNTPVDTTEAYYMRRERIASVAQNLTEQVRSKHFNGALRNPSVLMLMPDMLPNLPKTRRSIEQDRSLAFLVDAEMHSTGRGLIGHARRVYGLYITHEHMDFFLSSNQTTWIAREISITSRQLEIPQMQDKINELIELSRTRSREYYLNGLRGIVSGGLPSLGKASR